MLTLTEAIDKHVADRKNVISPATIKNYEWVKTCTFQSIKDVPLAKVTNWQALIDQEAARYSAKSVHTAWTLIRTVMNDLGLQNPNVKLPQIAAKDKPFLDPDQVKAFIEAIKGEPCEIAALLGLHGLRRSEILGLKWENVDLKNGIIKIRESVVVDYRGKPIQKKTTKTKASRRNVPIMIPELTAALEAVPQDKRVGNVLKCHPTTIREQVNRVCEKNALPLVGVHGLRRSFASLAFSAEVGMTEREVMEIGGWDDAQTMHRIYEQISQAQLRRASDKMRGFFTPTQIANENHNEVKKT